jgi:hypothetical protein
MPMTQTISNARNWEFLRPALYTGMFLCAANYWMDILFARLGKPASQTVLNDIGIGIFGALAVFFYLYSSHEKHKFDSAKERLAMVYELNQRIREALVVIAGSAMSEDRMARLRGIDQAADQIDDILSDFVTKQKIGCPAPFIWRDHPLAENESDTSSDSR